MVAPFCLHNTTESTSIKPPWETAQSVEFALRFCRHGNIPLSPKSDSAEEGENYDVIRKCVVYLR